MDDKFRETSSVNGIKFITLQVPYTVHDVSKLPIRWQTLHWNDGWSNVTLCWLWCLGAMKAIAHLGTRWCMGAQFLLCFQCFVMIILPVLVDSIYGKYLPMSFRVVSLAFNWQSYNCPSASETTLKNMVKTVRYQKQSKIQIVSILTGIYSMKSY